MYFSRSSRSSIFLLLLIYINISGYEQSIINNGKASVLKNEKLPTTENEITSNPKPAVTAAKTRPIDRNNPCNRECKAGEKPMTCVYNWTIENYQSMSKACYDCPRNQTDCLRPDCVTADGVGRQIIVVNRKMPGPSIEVCQHDRVIVNVDNAMVAAGTTVHWHGLHQKGTPFMDGAPYVTQCPMLPENKFRYEFVAEQAGTHFWHSHTGLQRADGVAGSFIIRTPKSADPHGKLYDFDRSDHVILVTDWIHEPTLGMFTYHLHSMGHNKPSSLLINGVGRFENNRTTTFIKVAKFNVEKGNKYRFRLINAEFLNCPIEMSVDGHNITVIASDGSELVPITVTSLVSYAGERFDFVIDANNKVDNYLIKFRGLLDCSVQFNGVRQVAVLHYEGAPPAPEPPRKTWQELHNNGLQINALNQGQEQNVTKSFGHMKSLVNYDDRLKPEPDHKFYVAYDLYSKNNSHFHRLPLYGYNQVAVQYRLFTPQLNHISMKLPSSPLLVSRPSSDNFCNSATINETCKQDYCQCSHVIPVKLNSIVEVVLIDEGTQVDINHPFHLHGYNFRVVAQRRLGNRTTVNQVKAFDESGQLKRNLKNAPVKDTVTIPDGGYTVIRFKADNPGYWLFHCHIEFHAEVGMALVFKVGEHKDMAPVPNGFPTCGNYK